MFQILIFTCLWHFTLLDPNCGDTLRSDVQFINFIEDKTLNRFPRGSRVPARVEKPVDCAKLHQTEETPFVAIILNRATGRLLCMGSIIDEKHILTAVKCVQSTNYKTLRILVGYFKAWWGRHSYVHYVEKVIKHEYELVILRLTLPLQFSRTIRPIRLLRFEDAEKPGGTGEASEGGGGKGKKNKGGAAKNKSSVPAKHFDTNTEEEEKSSNSNQDGSEFNDQTENDKDEENKPMDDNNAPQNYDELTNTTIGENDEYDTDSGDKEGTINNDSKTTDEEKTNSENEENEAVEKEGNDIMDKGHDSQNPINEGNEDQDNNSEKEYSNDDENENQGNEALNGVAETYFQLAADNNYFDEIVNMFKRADDKKEAPENQTFAELHKKIKDKGILVVGFPLTDEDVVGDPIPQTLVYGMRPENLTEEEDACIKAYQEKPALTEEEDPYAKKRIICTKGTSKFCWGCLGGPTLYKREKEYIQVGVIIGAKCEKKDGTDPYMHARVDYHMKWISKNSYVHFRN